MSKGKAKIPEPEPEPVKIEVPETGSGDFLLPDNSKYSGEWKVVNGLKQRCGTGTWISGPEKYVGQWDNDSMNGQGEYTFSSNSVYNGNFSNNLFHGEGVYSFADGASYNGSWFANKMHGKGLYTDADKVEFSGDFVNGLYNSGRSYISLRQNKAV